MDAGVSGVYEFLRKKYKVTNTRIGQIIKKAEAIKACEISDYESYKRKEAKRIKDLWTSKYRKRYKALPHDRKEATMSELVSIIHDMTLDGFTQSDIGSYFEQGEKLGGRKAIDRTTINYHVSRLKI